MEVYALVGPAGTGKSHRAILIARDYGISVLIDDGLLIHGSQVVAGRSAKHERSMMAATRRATFSHPAHAQEVRDALARIQPNRILLLGTSRSMIGRICDNLVLPQPQRFVDIKDVATPDEIRLAHEARQTEGKHVIPAPTLEVKKRFARQLVSPLRLLYRDKNGLRRMVVEKSVVRPTFNSLGRFFIAEEAMATIFRHLLSQADPIAAVHHADVESQRHGVVFRAEVTLHPRGQLTQLLAGVQRDIRHTLEELTAVNVLSLDLTATQVVTSELRTLLAAQRHSTEELPVQEEELKA